MFNILTDATFSFGVVDIIILIAVALAFVAAVIYAFITGKLTLGQVIKDPMVLKRMYDKFMKKLNNKIAKAEKKEEKAIKKEDIDKELKYRQEKERLIQSKCDFEECSITIAHLEHIIEDKEDEKEDEPKLDNLDEL